MSYLPYVCSQLLATIGGLVGRMDVSLPLAVFFNINAGTKIRIWAHLLKVYCLT